MAPEMNLSLHMLLTNVNKAILILISMGVFYFTHHFDFDEVVGVLAVHADDGSVRHPGHESDGQFVRVRVYRLISPIQRVVIVDHGLPPLLTKLIPLSLWIMSC